MKSKKTIETPTVLEVVEEVKPTNPCPICKGEGKERFVTKSTTVYKCQNCSFSWNRGR